MKISLLHNAYSFIEEAIIKAIAAEQDTIHWKFATLNLVQAIELSLKEKLRIEHPILIFENIDKPKNTVNLTMAINRLKNILKIDFTKTDITTIKSALKLRNEIMHFEFEIRNEQFKLIFAKLIGFLSHFHTIHLNSSLDENIKAELWYEAISILEYADELFNRASQIFKDKKYDPFFIWVCPQCEWEAFVIQDDINTCYVCGYKTETIICPDCGNVFFIENCHELRTSPNVIDYYCTDCYEMRLREYEAEADYYHEMMSYFYYK